MTSQPGEQIITIHTSCPICQEVELMKYGDLTKKIEKNFSSKIMQIMWKD